MGKIHPRLPRRNAGNWEFLKICYEFFCHFVMSFCNLDMSFCLFDMSFALLVNFYKSDLSFCNSELSFCNPDLGLKWMALYTTICYMGCKNSGNWEFLRFCSEFLQF